jgi:hypothetical protein
MHPLALPLCEVQLRTDVRSQVQLGNETNSIFARNSGFVLNGMIFMRGTWATKQFD